MYLLADTLPPAFLDSYTRALLVSHDGRHLFVTPCYVINRRNPSKMRINFWKKKPGSLKIKKRFEWLNNFSWGVLYHGCAVWSFKKSNSRKFLINTYCDWPPFYWIIWVSSWITVGLLLSIFLEHLLVRILNLIGCFFVTKPGDTNMRGPKPEVCSPCLSCFRWK